MSPPLIFWVLEGLSSVFVMFLFVLVSVCGESGVNVAFWKSLSGGKTVECEDFGAVGRVGVTGMSVLVSDTCIRATWLVWAIMPWGVLQKWTIAMTKLNVTVYNRLVLWWMEIYNKRKKTESLWNWHKLSSVKTIILQTILLLLLLWPVQRRTLLELPRAQSI